MPPNERNHWLSEPADPTASDAELEVLLGQAIVDAMVLIESKNVRRRAIIADKSAPAVERNTALRGGVWYASEYSTALASLGQTPRIDWMQRTDISGKGLIQQRGLIRQREPISADQTRIVPYTFRWQQTTADALSPAEALVDILQGNALCVLECATALTLSHYAALLKVWGKERFDRCFAGVDDFTLPMTVSSYAEKNPMYLFLKLDRMTDVTQLKRGDKIGFRNHPDYLKKHPKGEAAAWNVVVTQPGDAESIKFLGFGFDNEAKTITGVRDLLIAEYNKPATHGGASAASGFLPELTVEAFERASGTGLTSEIIQLDTERVKMILEQEPAEADLQAVFAATPAGAQRYAMDEVKLSAWSAASVMPTNS